MSFKFKVGDKVRVSNEAIMFAGEEGEVTGLGGTATPEQGAVVTNEEFESGDDSYGEHGIWFPDDWLELVQEGE